LRYNANSTTSSVEFCKAKLQGKKPRAFCPDTALILSGDSDLAPVTTKLKELCPGKKIGIIVPQNQSAMNLKQHADFFKKIQDRDLKKSLLPEHVTYNGTVITAPAGWLPKPKLDTWRGHSP
jgi:hypothetical protein